MAARQNTAPVAFERSVRTDEGVLMSSGKAGKVVPVAYIPILRGDSGSGRLSLDLNLAEMPKPLLNAVFVNAQAWFIPKHIHPQFSGSDEFLASYMKETIPTFQGSARTAPAFFLDTVPAAFAGSEFAKTLGIHVTTDKINVDLVDAFCLAYNFRLAAHSTKLARKKYYQEDAGESLALPRAFWPSGRFARMVPDYERALVVGDLDLDIQAGRIPIPGIVRMAPAVNANTGGSVSTTATNVNVFGTSTNGVRFDLDSNAASRLYADMAATTVTTSLADLDKARVTQAFAKLRASMAGNNVTGFVNDDVILAHLMQGLSVPSDQFKRPILLDAKRVPFGFAERHASDGDSLDKSVSQGRASVQLSLNVPQTDVGGLIIVTAEVLPERIDERQLDEWLHVIDPFSLPDALRDIRNPEPVDMVRKRRIDAKHTKPTELYGWEPMNDRWNRSFTRLGGSFYQPTPGAPVTEPRAGIWQANIVDPEFTADHWLAPEAFPHTVFSDTTKPAFEFVARHSLKIVGLTQIGDVLREDNSDFSGVESNQ